jgi:hypothetical protein
VDSGQLGHNTSFVPRVANSVLYILTEKQRAQLTALAAEQESLIREFAYRRFPLVKAYRRLLDGDIPAGKTGLDREAVAKYAAGLYEIDGRLSYRRAAVAGDIIAHLDARQKALLSKMTFGDSRTWPELGDQIDKGALPHARHVAVMTIMGAAIGAAAAYGIGRGAQSLLFGINGRDPLVMAASAVLLALVAMAAGSLPAWRASRVDPVLALRYE